jgi:cell wall-associated NlpC family hydrolase
MHKRTRKLKYIIATAIAGIALLFSAAPWNAGASTSIVRLYASRSVANGAVHYLGDRYVYGGTGPYSFDCSGLAQYVYLHYAGVSIPRTAEAQFLYFRQESQSRAWGGDLVFFHAYPGGPVYHTGIYEGGGSMVNAVGYAYGVRWTPLSWGGRYYTFGTISH